MFVRFEEPSPHRFVTKGWNPWDRRIFGPRALPCSLLHRTFGVPHRLNNPPTHALYALGACMSVPLLYMPFNVSTCPAIKQYLSTLGSQALTDLSRRGGILRMDGFLGQGLCLVAFYTTPLESHIA